MVKIIQKIRKFRTMDFIDINHSKLKVTTRSGGSVEYVHSIDFIIEIVDEQGKKEKITVAGGKSVLVMDSIIHIPSIVEEEKNEPSNDKK